MRFRALPFAFVATFVVAGCIAAGRSAAPTPTPIPLFAGGAAPATSTPSPTPTPAANPREGSAGRTAEIRSFSAENPSDGTEVLVQTRKVAEENYPYLIPVIYRIPADAEVSYSELRDGSGVLWAAFLEKERKMSGDFFLRTPMRILSATLEGEFAVFRGLEIPILTFANCPDYVYAPELGPDREGEFFGVRFGPDPQVSGLRCRAFSRLPAELDGKELSDGLALGGGRVLALYLNWSGTYEALLVEADAEGRILRKTPFASRFARWVFVVPEGGVCMGSDSDPNALDCVLAGSQDLKASYQTIVEKRLPAREAVSRIRDLKTVIEEVKR